MDDISRAIDAAGGVHTVAATLQISHEAVYKWRRQRRVPSNRVRDLCALGRWAVTPHQLAPDYYPNPKDGLPPRRPAKQNTQPDVGFR